MNLKDEFPITNQITYLDNGSSTLKPQVVIDAISKFYSQYPISPHSPNSPLAIKVAKKVQKVRQALANLVDAKETEIIFNSGATQGLNTISKMISQILEPKAEIIVWEFNHDSNVLPWLELEKTSQVKVVITPNIIDSITPKTKVIAITQVPNAIGPKINLAKIFKVAHQKKILVINDAAQALTSQKVSLNESDVITLSGNKLYGPTGSGAIVVRTSLLKKLKPITFGGGTVITFRKERQFTFRNGITVFEPGTPNTAGIIGLGAAINFYHQTKDFIKKAKELAIYAYKKLEVIPNLTIYSELGNLAIIFNYKNFPPQDISAKLAHKHAIYTRSGNFCANLCSRDGGALRVSIGIYNTKADIDKLITALKNEDFYSID